MGVRVLYDEEKNMAAIYCSTTDWAFGPVVYGGALEADRLAEKFLKWLAVDPRGMSNAELEGKWSEFYCKGWHACKTCCELVTSSEVECEKCAEADPNKS